MENIRVFVNDKRVYTWDYEGLSTTYDPSIIDEIDELEKKFKEMPEKVLYKFLADYGAEIILVKVPVVIRISK